MRLRNKILDLEKKKNISSEETQQNRNLAIGKESKQARGGGCGEKNR